MTTLIGYKKVDFKDKEGKEVKGCSIFFTEEDDNTFGLSCYKLFLSEEKSQKLFSIYNLKDYLGVECKIEYNRYGKFAGIEF